jgi:hypothetical protein
LTNAEQRGIEAAMKMKNGRQSVALLNATTGAAYYFIYWVAPTTR